LKSYNIIAYCNREWWVATRKAIGVVPSESFAGIESADFIFFAYHGLPSSCSWFNAKGEIVITTREVKEWHLNNPIIFAASCYMDTSGFPQAFLDAGASAVIGGYGLNDVAITGYGGAHLLGNFFLRFLKLGLNASTALKLAKIGTLYDWSSAARDSRAFRLWGNPNAKLGDRNE
jgi:hypothetical protein